MEPRNILLRPILAFPSRAAIEPWGVELTTPFPTPTREDYVDHHDFAIAINMRKRGARVRKHAPTPLPTIIYKISIDIVYHIQYTTNTIWCVAHCNVIHTDISHK